MSNTIQPPEYSLPPAPYYSKALANYQRPRSSYRWLWIVLGVFALLCLVGGALVWVFAVSPVGGPTIASDQYYTAIRDNDYTKAYGCLGTDLRASVSQEAFARHHRDTVVRHHLYGASGAAAGGRRVEDYRL